MIESLAVVILVVLLLIIVLWAIDSLLLASIPIDPRLKQLIFVALFVLVLLWAILVLTGHARVNFG